MPEQDPDPVWKTGPDGKEYFDQTAFERLRTQAHINVARAVAGYRQAMDQNDVQKALSYVL